MGRMCSGLSAPFIRGGVELCHLLVATIRRAASVTD